MPFVSLLPTEQTSLTSRATEPRVTVSGDELAFRVHSALKAPPAVPIGQSSRPSPAPPPSIAPVPLRVAFSGLRDALKTVVAEGKPRLRRPKAQPVPTERYRATGRSLSC